MILPPPRSTPTDTLLPSTTLFRSAERRIVPAARGRNALVGRADLVFERPERRVVLLRRGHPGLGVAAGRQLGTEIVRQALQVGDAGAGDLGQRLVGVGQGVALGDGVGARAVVGGAGLVHVGDRGQAHFQALVGVVELALERSLGGLGRGQGLDRPPHVDVGRRGRGRRGAVRRLAVDGGRGGGGG